MNLGEKIYQLRTSKGYSQDKLSEMLDVSRQSISKWENNSAVPELDKLVKLSEIFEISLDMLVKGEEINIKTENKTIDVNVISTDRISQSQRTVGFVFLGLFALLFIIGTAFGGVAGFVFSLIIGIPLVISGVICLICKKHAVLWSSWVMYISYTSYLLMATGINIHTIMNVFRGGIDFSIQSIISLIELIIFIVLVLNTIFKLGNGKANIKNSKIYFLISILLFIVIVVIEYNFNGSSLYWKIMMKYEFRGWLITLIHTIFDWIKTILFISLGVNGFNYLKNRQKK